MIGRLLRLYDSLFEAFNQHVFTLPNQQPGVPIMSNPDYETDMRVWKGEEDWIVARSRKELIEVLINLGWEEEEEGGWELLPPEKNLTIWEGSPGENEQTKTCAEWANESTEPGLLASSNWCLRTGS